MGYVFEVWPASGARKNLPKVGGFAPHILQDLPGPPGPARPQKRTPPNPARLPSCTQLVDPYYTHIKNPFKPNSNFIQTQRSLASFFITLGQESQFFCWFGRWGVEASPFLQNIYGEKWGRSHPPCPLGFWEGRGRFAPQTAGFRPDCYLEGTEFGPPAGWPRPKSGPEGRFPARKDYCVT